MSDRALAQRMGNSRRERAVTHFGWPAVARKTVELYGDLLSGS